MLSHSRWCPHAFTKEIHDSEFDPLTTHGQSAISGSLSERCPTTFDSASFRRGKKDIKIVVLKLPQLKQRGRKIKFGLSRHLVRFRFTFL